MKLLDLEFTKPHVPFSQKYTLKGGVQSMQFETSKPHYIKVTSTLKKKKSCTYIKVKTQVLNL